MQSRFQPLLSLAGTVLLAALPLTGLAAQGATMSKDEGSMAKPTAMSGMLHGAGGHHATGTVHLVAKGDQHQIHFTPDFKAGSSSDVYVVLSKSEAPEAGSVQLGKLKHVAGEQTIDVPAKVDVSQYSHLLLWSKKDNAVIGMTDLAEAGMSMDHEKMGHDSQPQQH